MAIIKRIKLPSMDSAYDIGAKYDVDGNEIKQMYATKTDLANLVDTAPETLNSLNKLVAALNDDPNFAATVTAELEKKSGAVMKAWTNSDVQ